jgi:hypothetical protein
MQVLIYTTHTPPAKRYHVQCLLVKPLGTPVVLPLQHSAHTFVQHLPTPATLPLQHNSTHISYANTPIKEQYLTENNTKHRQQNTMIKELKKIKKQQSSANELFSFLVITDNRSW